LAPPQVNGHEPTDTAGARGPYDRRVEQTPLKDAIDGWLADGPQPVDELTTRAVAAGLVEGADDEDWDDEAFHAVRAIIESSDDYWTVGRETVQEAVTLVRPLVDSGLTLTHRVTAGELEAEAVAAMPDLAVLLWNLRGGAPLADGSGSLTSTFGAGGAWSLTGPPGWLDAAQAGDLVAFTRQDGVVRLEVVAESALGDGTTETDALRDACDAWVGAGRGEEEVPIVMDALARDAALFRRPVPPIGELLVAAGLERRGNEWGVAGEAWRTTQERLADERRDIQRLYGFEPCCDRAFERVGQAFRDQRAGEGLDGRAVADALGHGTVAPAFAHSYAEIPSAVLEFATAAAAATTGRHAAPALTLAGLAHLRAGEPLEAIHSLEAAVRADPDFALAAGALAELEMDRGNVTRAMSLAVRDEDAAGLVRWIEEERARQAALRPSAGRNDPCPCGSGQKFKRCCANRTELALADRMPLLRHRLAWYAAGPEGHRVRFGLTLSAAGGYEDVLESIRRFQADAFLLDVAIHEGGLGEEYLERRAPLLAADERALLEAVLAEPRRLWEVVEVTAEGAAVLRDVRSDAEPVTVTAGVEGRQPGDLVLGRLAPVPGRSQLFGLSLAVPESERDRLLRVIDTWVDADTLAMWYGSVGVEGDRFDPADLDDEWDPLDDGWDDNGEDDDLPDD
jgi:hypothetical protein